MVVLNVRCTKSLVSKYLTKNWLCKTLLKLNKFIATIKN